MVRVEGQTKNIVVSGNTGYLNQGSFGILAEPSVGGIYNLAVTGNTVEGYNGTNGRITLDYI